jgi:rRNA processing protein Gar1
MPMSKLDNSTTSCLVTSVLGPLTGSHILIKCRAQIVENPFKENVAQMTDFCTENKVKDLRPVYFFLATTSLS